MNLDALTAPELLEELRRQLEDAEHQDAADNIHLPLCHECHAPLGLAPSATRDGVGHPRCGPCARARKARRRADRQRLKETRTMTTDHAATWLTQFCDVNAAAERATGRTDDQITADALAVYDLWAGTAIPLDLPSLVLHGLAAAAYALDVDPDVTTEETRVVVWGFAKIAGLYAEQCTAADMVAELDAWRAEQ
jgi:hypothetical protein